MSVVKRILLEFLSIVVGLGMLIVAFPFMFVYHMLQIFWTVFGASVIAFIIIALFGGTMEDCIKYSAGLGFFVGAVMKGIEMSRKETNN